MIEKYLTTPFLTFFTMDNICIYLLQRFKIYDLVVTHFKEDVSYFTASIYVLEPPV